MKNIQKITLHANEIKNGNQKFIACSSEINKKWYKIKFTKKCNEIPREKGIYDLTVDIDDLSVERGKPYVNKDGKKVMTNDIIWVNNVTELRKYTEEDFKEVNRITMQGIFGE